MKNFKPIIILMILIFVFAGCRKNTTTSLSNFQENSSHIHSIDYTEKDVDSVESKENISSQIVSSEENTLSDKESSKKNETDSSKNQNSSIHINNNSTVKSTSSNVSLEIENKGVKTKGIDVSKWQGKIDWKKVKSSGIDFAIIRIGQRGENGKIVKDDCADYNIQQAEKNGILIGIYYFSTAISLDEATEDAKWVYEAIKYYPVSYPVVWDCEGFSSVDSRMYSLSNSQRTNIAITFLDKIKSIGYEGMFYAAASDLTDSVKWDTEKIQNKYKIWVASYPDLTYPQIETPNYIGKYDMWQYTDKGSVSGIKGDVDLVVSYFSANKASPKSSTKPPKATEPEENDGYTAVNIKVTAKDTVNLRDSDSTGGKIVGTLKNGEILTKIAEGVNGWAKLEYNGKIVFAVSSYLTEDLSYKPPKKETSDGFKTVNEAVTAKDKTNLRTVPTSSDDSTIVYTLKNGEIAKRIGISDNGWSKLEYEGKTLYAVSSFLTTDLNYKSSVSSEENTSSEFKTTFTEVSEKVTAKSETNLRSRPTVNESEVVYTLKNGEYVTRTGVSENGWSRLEYNGKTVYAISSYLTK